VLPHAARARRALRLSSTLAPLPGRQELREHDAHRAAEVGGWGVSAWEGGAEEGALPASAPDWEWDLEGFDSGALGESLASEQSELLVGAVDSSLQTDSAEMVERQLRLEEEAVEVAVRDAREVQASVVSLGRGMELQPMRRLEHQWLTALVAAVDGEQGAVLSGSSVWGKPGKVASEEVEPSGGSMAGRAAGPYLLLLPPEKLSVIALHTTLNLLLARGGAVPTTTVMSRIGAMVEAEVNMSKLRGRDRRAWEQFQGAMDAKKLVSLRQRCRSALDDADWPEPIKVRLGAVLLKCLVDVAEYQLPARDLDSARVEWFASNTGAIARPFAQHEGLARHVRLHEATRRLASSLSEKDGTAPGEDSSRERLERMEAERLKRLAQEGGPDRAGVDTVWGGADEALPVDGPPQELLASATALRDALQFVSLSSDAGAPDQEAAPYDSSWMSNIFPPPSPTELHMLDALRFPARHLADGGAAFAKPGKFSHQPQDSGATASDDDADATPPKGSRVSMPALVHSYMWGAVKRKRGGASARAAVGVLRLHPRVFSVLEEAGPSASHQLFHPMLVRPRPWRGADKGGYLRQRSRIMRTKGSRQQMAVLKEARMPGMFDALNVLGNVAWRVNGDVRRVVKEVWDTGGGIGEVPPRQDHPEPLPPMLDAIESEEERKNQFRSWKRMCSRVQQWNRDLHSLRCDHILKMQVADRFQDDVMYFPHNLDFRGRAYPIPPHLNHMGADICRGLLTFAEKRELGPQGLRWLKIHLANKMGKDKVSFDEREQWVDDHMHEVLDCADRPLSGNGWWLSADSPWQALATCFELANATRSSNPMGYLSCLPVHQDGTCNGLQHYAALGRDFEGGKAVNLVEADRPQDVYSAVLRLVQAQVEQDALLSEQPPEGVPEDELAEYLDRRMCAQFVQGHVVRKTIKQTVMTSVYGVTFIGARDQIRNRLRETFEPRREELGLTPDDLDALVFKSSAYLARTTLSSLGKMFEAADAIKSWLTQAARLVATTNQPMAWITPLGLPVVQPYRRNSSQTVATIMQQVVLAGDNDTLPVSSQKQGSAFPPNFVHSLDSTHMMLTASECTRRGMVFTAVHDSYWTHACNIDAMNMVLRDCFVKLYEMPLLEELRDSLVLRFPGLRIPELPKRGSLDLGLVRSSPYFFN
jgi:DNA-directed RNA polymerase